ncbi:hypothetical protein HHK36_007205 [Tetracentron sinense]|uniref:WRKY domain-containing protein n=1 Tax=Tetracentron sinense TaxID=13715 RepID=A0A835DPR4_TETSI|nr:hypothetical protein HHK36_007205 [Tetracentron sinense]
METTLKKYGLGGVVKEEKRTEYNGDEEDYREIREVRIVATTERSSMDTNSRATSSNQKNIEEDQLESAKARIGEVREENERLKTDLARIVKDYQSLQMNFFDIVQQEEATKSTVTVPMLEEIEEPELVSLSLGRISSDPKKDEKTSNSSKTKEDVQLKEDLALGLDCKLGGRNPRPIELILNPRTETSFEEPKEEEAGETWPPRKKLKTATSGDDEISQQTYPKKARVSVRARCDTATMNDGCQWRKYGQKIAKGNPCPRGYYRCTIAPSCPVRKQVQRCAEDMSILITTYEGTHNHPLPISATAFASTTSAAACMLTNGSTSSQPSLGAMATTANLHGLSFNLSDNSRSKQFYLSNSSIYASHSHPIITLDLTAPPASSSSPSFSDINMLSSTFAPPTPRYPSTSLSFSSSESNNLPTSWSNGYLSYINQLYNKSQIGSLNLGRQHQEHLYQSHILKNNHTPPQQSLMETIAAATNAVTSDPSFQSALLAAIASVVGKGGGAGAHGNQSGEENFGQNLKWGEPFSAISPYPSTSNGNG